MSIKRKFQRLSYNVKPKPPEAPVVSVVSVVKKEADDLLFIAQSLHASPTQTDVPSDLAYVASTMDATTADTRPAVVVPPTVRERTKPTSESKPIKRLREDGSMLVGKGKRKREWRDLDELTAPTIDPMDKAAQLHSVMEGTQAMDFDQLLSETLNALKQARTFTDTKKKKDKKKTKKPPTRDKPPVAQEPPVKSAHFCNTWACEGYCQQGERCVYSHDLPPACCKKGSPCFKYVTMGECDKEPCKYSHEFTLKPKHPTPHSIPVICHFEVSGSCVKGDWCEFDHDIKHKVTCRFWRWGRCEHSDEQCRFAHQIVDGDTLEPVPLSNEEEEEAV
jgi:hypothetical protein